MKIEPDEIVNATKNKLGRADALRLAKNAAKVIVAKGRSVVTFDMSKDAPKDADLLAALLGPTGNLRAPTIRVGRTLLVGFNEDAYKRVLA